MRTDFDFMILFHNWTEIRRIAKSKEDKDYNLLTYMHPHTYACTETYAVVLDIRYEDIIGMSTGGIIFKHLSVTDKTDEEHRFQFYRKTPVELVPYIKQLMDIRQEEIEKEKAKERIQIIADFSFLKSVMQKGGIILQAISCPFCGASVPLPETGKVFKCNYCNKDIYVVDVFRSQYQHHPPSIRRTDSITRLFWFRAIASNY